MQAVFFEICSPLTVNWLLLSRSILAFQRQNRTKFDHALRRIAKTTREQQNRVNVFSWSVYTKSKNSWQTWSNWKRFWCWCSTPEAIKQKWQVVTEYIIIGFSFQKYRKLSRPRFVGKHKPLSLIMIKRHNFFMPLYEFCYFMAFGFLIFLCVMMVLHV